MGFKGFSKKGDRFFLELAMRQDRDWFKAHKEQYESLWVEPMQALLADLRPGLQRAFKGFKLAPDKIFRLQRDVRFSKDKSPYKTFASAVVKLDDGSGNDLSDGAPAAIYLQFGSSETVALGHWMFEGPALEKYRQLLLDDKKGAAIAAKVRKLGEKGFTVGAFETLKKAPRGVDPNHPRAWLLVHKGLGLEFPKIPAKVRHSAQLSKWVLEHVKLAAPLVCELEKWRNQSR